jgi:hypothetical protein
MMSGSDTFRCLDAAQLLKQALGLATERPGRRVPELRCARPEGSV